MTALLAAAYLFTAQPTTHAPKPNSCVLVLHKQTRAVESRHCPFDQPGKTVRGTVFLVD
jgi:hypothetical protein